MSQNALSRPRDDRFDTATVQRGWIYRQPVAQNPSVSLTFEVASVQPSLPIVGEHIGGFEGNIKINQALSALQNDGGPTKPYSPIARSSAAA
jgi:hypothetical protein